MSSINHAVKITGKFLKQGNFSATSIMSLIGTMSSLQTNYPVISLLMAYPKASPEQKQALRSSPAALKEFEDHAFAFLKDAVLALKADGNDGGFDVRAAQDQLARIARVVELVDESTTKDELISQLELKDNALLELLEPSKTT